MQLYSSPLSPFGARVMIAARTKGLDLRCAPLPAGGIKSPEYLAINPVGRIPVLVTESGCVIPESTAILGYLEDRFPKPSLRPADPEQRARIDVVIRMMDTYVMAPVIRLFSHLDPARRDERMVAHELGLWKDGLAALAHFMQTPLPAAEAGLSLADCVLPPSLHLSARIAMMLELKDDLLRPHAALAAYYARMKQHPIVGTALRELTLAQAAKDVKSGLPSLADRH
jgi:glutathione S-transferase